MKTFGELTINDVIYEIEFFNGIKTKELTIVSIKEDKDLPFRKIFKVSLPDAQTTPYHFANQAWIDSNYASNTYWTTSKDIVDVITRAFNKGVNYQKKKIKALLDL